MHPVFFYDKVSKQNLPKRTYNLFQQACKQSVCSLQSDDEETLQAAVCEALTVYMMSCVSAGAKILQWMQKFDCSWRCPAGNFHAANQS